MVFEGINLVQIILTEKILISCTWYFIHSSATKSGTPILYLIVPPREQNTAEIHGLCHISAVF